MSIYDIDFRTEEQKILPPPKRENLVAPVVKSGSYSYQPGRVIKSFINALFTGGIQTLSNLIFSISSTDAYAYVNMSRKAKYNGQIIILTALLNKEVLGVDIASLSPTPSIYIVDNTITNRSFRVGIKGDVNESTVTVKGASRDTIGLTPTAVSGFDFTVYAPTSLTSIKKSQLVGLVSKYSLYGTKVTYIYY